MAQNNKKAIIAGNNLFPVLLAKKIKQKEPDTYLVAIAFRGETKAYISKYVDKIYWLKVGKLSRLRAILKTQQIKQVIMAGQINPRAIFKQKNWDREMIDLAKDVKDFRPHTIFSKIIALFQQEGVQFLNSLYYAQDSVCPAGILGGVAIPETVNKDIAFGSELISRYVELDVGQTIVCKKRTALALEGFDGTDQTILRGARIGGSGCSVFKFSKKEQDLRFDVPIVGLKTLKLLKKIKAAALILEAYKVIILEKEKFLQKAQLWSIPVIGKARVS